MVDLEVLARQARFAAEVGRVRAAIRVLPAVAALCVLANAAHPQTLVAQTVAGVVLAGAVVGFRVAGRHVGRAGVLGFVAGSAPVLALFVLRGACGPGAFEDCGAECAFVGFAAGALVSVRAFGDLVARPRTWFALGVTASLTTMVGCIALGRGVALLVLLTTLGGVASAWVVRRLGVTDARG